MRRWLTVLLVAGLAASGFGHAPERKAIPLIGRLLLSNGSGQVTDTYAYV